MLQLRDHQVAISGRFKGFQQNALTAHLLTLGAMPVKKVKSPQDILLLGHNPKVSVVQHARAIGAQVIEGEPLYDLLEEGEVEWPQPGARPVNELIGECRALFDGEATRARWEAVVALFDSCVPEQRADFLAYLEPLLEGWRPSTPGEFEVAAGAARVATIRMMLDAMAGRPHPLGKWVEAIYFGGIEVSSALSAKLFAQDYFPRAHILDMGGIEKYNHFHKTPLVQALASSKLATRVTTLRPECIRMWGDLELLRDAFPQLETLLISGLSGDAFSLLTPYASKLHCLSYDLGSIQDSAAVDWSTLGSLSKLCLTLQPMPFSQLHRLVHPDLCSSVTTLSLQARSMDVVSDFLRALTQLTPLSLTTLDLSHVSGSPVSQGSAGRAFFEDLLTETGLLPGLKQLTLNDQVSVESCQRLEQLGLQVTSPHNLAVEVAAPVRIEQGEHASFQDILRVDYKDAHGWAVVTSALNELEDLEVSLSDEQLERLSTHLSRWPDTVRHIPWHWSGKLVRAQRDPFLALASSLSLEAINYNSKATLVNRRLDALLTSPHLDALSHIQLRHFPSQKSVLRSLEGLMNAMQPEQVSVAAHSRKKDSQKVQRHLETYLGARVLSDEITWGTDTTQRELGDNTREHVRLEIHTAQALGELLQTRDMAHVRTLTLSIRLHSTQHLPPHTTAVVADFSRLESLHVVVHGQSAQDLRLCDLAAQWLARAQPRHVSSSPASLTYDLALAGAYERARSSILQLHSLAQEDVMALLGHDAIRVAGIHVDGQLQRSFAQLTAAMHPDLARSLRGWRAPQPQRGALEGLGQFLEACPNMGALIVEGPAQEKTLEHISQTPETRQLFVLNRADARSPDSVLSKEQCAILDEGVGLPSSRYLATTYPRYFHNIFF